MLKPGGMLLYSTCTFDASENEQTIEYLISQYPEFAVCPIEPYDGFTQGMPEVTAVSYTHLDVYKRQNV